jgi:hypothetical protein
MLDGQRIVVCVPYGRKRTVSILMNYFRRDRSIIDEVQFWMNTDPDQVEDVAFAREQEKLYPGWVRCVDNPSDEILTPKQYNTGFFYALAQDKGTYYFRFDDDIVYVHPRYFEEMVKLRRAKPEYFLIMGNILNNAVVSWVHQQAGRIGRQHGSVQSAWCMDPVGWGSLDFAIALHNQFLDSARDGEVDNWLFSDPWPLDGRRFSISNFLWVGDSVRMWGGATHNRDEEIFLTEEWPRYLRQNNVINGMALVVHYSFFTQRGLDDTDILDRYRSLSEEVLSKDYYKLLGETR